MATWTRVVGDDSGAGKKMVSLEDFQRTHETGPGAGEGIAQISLWIQWMEDKIDIVRG